MDQDSTHNKKTCAAPKVVESENQTEAGGGCHKQMGGEPGQNETTLITIIFRIVSAPSEDSLWVSLGRGSATHFVCNNTNYINVMYWL